MSKTTKAPQPLKPLPLYGAEGAEMNQARAERARQALQVGTDYDGKDEADIGIYAGDLVCNLRHLLDEAGISFESVLERADMHYEAEVEEAEEEKKALEEESK